MPIPDYQTLMRPLLSLLADNGEMAMRDLRSRLAEQFALSAEELEAMLPGGSTTVFSDRVGWARYYLQRAGMLEAVRRGVYRATDRGRGLLREVEGRVTTGHLAQRSPEFTQWIAGSRVQTNPPGTTDVPVDQQMT